MQGGSVTNCRSGITRRDQGDDTAALSATSRRRWGHDLQSELTAGRGPYGQCPAWRNNKLQASNNDQKCPWRAPGAPDRVNRQTWIEDSRKCRRRSGTNSTCFYLL